jgi:hypothetical protein
MIGELLLCPRPNRSDMQHHLEWLRGSAYATHPELRFEIAWGDPGAGPNSAKTFRLDQLEAAVAFAAWINSKGCNVYVGATLKRADAPDRGRTGSQHATLATALPVDFDGDFVAGARKLGGLAKPQMMVITGRTPEVRGQLWIKIKPTADMDIWNEVNRRSVCFCGGDRNALGTYRLMRLAGSVSYPSPQKRERRYVAELTCGRLFDAPAHDLRELLDRFPPATAERATRTPKMINLPGAGNEAILGSNVPKRLPLNRTNVALVQSMLDALPLEYAHDFGLWLRVGFSLQDFDDGELGLALWKRFSGRCPDKAENTDFDTRWATLNRDYQGRKISIGWLRGRAQAQGWRAPCRWDRSTKIAS